ncbi:MAG: hypothetical protein HY662_00835, partial [Chloroflexi bacterium]|nr:hypothetical protein [Chloroflexota bacterium]
MPALTNVTLQKRVSLLVLAGLVVGLGSFTWLGVQSLNESTARELDQRLTIARIMASHLDEKLNHVLSHLQSVTTPRGELPTREEFVSLAGSLRERFAESGISIQHTILADRNGKVLLVEPGDYGIIGSDMYHYPEIRRALEGGQPSVSNLISDSQMGTPVFLATAPIVSERNEVLGVLASAIDVERSGIRSFGQIV